MSKFLSDLAFHYTANVANPTDAAYLALVDRQNEMDDRIAQTLGLEFLEEYSALWWNIADRSLDLNFREGIRFGLRLAEELSPKEGDHI